MATNLTKIQENGLLAELAYLKLENFQGDITNTQEIRDFINGYNRDQDIYLPENERQELTNIDFNRQTQILDLLNKYEIVGFRSDDGFAASDFQGMMLKEKGTENYTGAIRGTDSKTDVINDVVNIGIAGYNAQIAESKKFINDMMIDIGFSKENLTLTGHSLGGIHVQQLSMEMQIEGYAYNPFGSSRLVADEILDNTEYQDFAKENIYTISYNDFGTINGDPLSNFATQFMNTEHIGSTYNFYGKNLGLDGHGGSNLNQLMEEHIDADFTLEDVLSYNQSLKNEFWEQMGNKNVDVTATKPDGTSLDFTMEKQNNDVTLMLDGTANFNNVFGDIFKDNNLNINFEDTSINQTYQVKSGDTLWQIAQSKGTTVEKLLELNPYLEAENRVSKDNSYVLIRPKDQIAFSSDSSSEEGSTSLSNGDSGASSYNPINSEIVSHDPLALDLNHNKIIDTKNWSDSNAYFDLDDNGTSEKTGWISNGDGWLVYDEDENEIGDARRLEAIEKVA